MTLSSPAIAAARQWGSRRARWRRHRARRAVAAPPVEHRMLQTATMCLLAFGAVMVYSATSPLGLLRGGGATGYLVRYLIYGAIGVGIMNALSRTSLRALQRATPMLLALAGFFVVAVLGVGVTVNGARRWLGAGPLQFQPSELLKLALVLYAAHILAHPRRRGETLRQTAGPLLVVAGVACGLVALQPDLGTAIVIALTVGALLVAAGVPTRQLLMLAAGAALIVLLYALLQPYRRARLTAFLDPWANPSGSGFQLVQGQIAVGSGGLLGVGLGRSVQKAFYLPEAHTDFILAVVGEELGVAGICGLLFLYGMILYAGLRTAKAAVGRYAKLLATGITSLILCQATLNVFTVLGLAPLTGVPLPFVSYGSSNLLILLACMGLLLNIANGGTLQARASRRGRGKASSSGASDEDRDRRRRNGGSRRAGARGRGRAAG